jgi:IS605 OrfB family transposase
MTSRKLREWRGVKEVAAPAGVAITTRLRTTPEDDRVLDLVAAHLGALRRADLALVSHPVQLGPGLDGEQKYQARKDRLNLRKKGLTAQSTARWANAITRSNDAQYQLERRNQARRIAELRDMIAVIEARLKAPTLDMKPREERCRRRAKTMKGYLTQAERYSKQQRLQFLKAKLASLTAPYDGKDVSVVAGGRRLAGARHNLDAAGLTAAGWRERWSCARWLVEANGSSDEPFGNLTITVAPDGETSIRLPGPLEHLANRGTGRLEKGRYFLTGRAVFPYRGSEWLDRVTGGLPVSYAFTRKLGRAGVYLTASWAIGTRARPEGEARAFGTVAAVDLNAGHLAIRRVDEHGNPAGQPHTIWPDCTGSSSRRDAQVRHAVTRLTNYTLLHGIDTIAIEDLDFNDARATGRETMGRGKRGKKFRRTVAGMATAVFRDRLAAQAHRRGIRLLAVNPAYTSQWGDEHWRKPYNNVTRHAAAATVIGRRAQGHKARRRTGVTRTQPEDCAVRATVQASQRGLKANTGDRHRPGMRGAKSRLPSRLSTRPPDGGAAVTPALANKGQPH